MLHRAVVGLPLLCGFESLRECLQLGLGAADGLTHLPWDSCSPVPHFFLRPLPAAAVVVDLFFGAADGGAGIAAVGVPALKGCADIPKSMPLMSGAEAQLANTSPTLATDI